MPVTSPVATRAEAETYLRISRTTLHRLVAEGELNPARVGRRLLFRLDELEQFLEAHRVRPIEGAA